MDKRCRLVVFVLVAGHGHLARHREQQEKAPPGQHSHGPLGITTRPSFDYEWSRSGEHWVVPHTAARQLTWNASH
jgi:hypothetical protein